MAAFTLLSPGDPAPRVMQRNSSGERYNLDLAAGRWLVLCFFRSSASAHAAAVLTAVRKRCDLFDDSHAAFFGVTTDHEDEAQKRLTTIVPGYRFFWDYDNKIARAYGIAPLDGSEGLYFGKWVIINPMMRVTAVIPFREDRGDIAEALVTHGEAKGAACVIEAEQLCLLLGEDRRGDERVRTQAFAGCFEDNHEFRQEFLRAVGA